MVHLKEAPKWIPTCGDSSQNLDQVEAIPASYSKRAEERTLGPDNTLCRDSKSSFAQSQQ
jgi:hypothetical protein